MNDPLDATIPAKIHSPLGPQDPPDGLHHPTPNSATFTLDPAGTVLSWNRGAERIFGYTAAEIVSRNYSRLFAPAQILAQKPSQNLQLAATEGSLEKSEWCCTAHGVTFCASITLTQLQNSLSQPVGFVQTTRCNVPPLKGDSSAATPESYSESAHSLEPVSRTSCSLQKAISSADLVASEMRYRRLFEAAQDGILILDSSTRKIQEANPFLANLLEFPPNELVGKELWEIGLLKDIVANKELFKKLQKLGYVRYECYPLLTKSGQHIDVEFVSNSYDVLGTLVIQCNIRDITDRKRSEDSLKASEERYRTLVEATSAIVWSTPQSGGFETDQPDWSSFTGQTFEELRGWGWLNAIHPEDRDRTAKVWSEAFEQKWIYYVEHRLRRVDGLYRHMVARAVPILNLDGSIREWFGIHIDVTERKKTEEALLLHDRAIKAATQGLMIADVTLPNHPIVYVSPACETITGYQSSDFLGLNCRFLQGKDSDPLSIKLMKNAVENGVPCSVEILNYRKDGTPFWNAVSLSPIRDDAGLLTHYVAVQVDVTSRRKLESQFLQAQKMEAVGQLAGGIAHDFNNLLTIILGYCDLLIEALPPEDSQRELLNEIQNAGLRAAGLTRQLLAFSRKSVLEIRTLDLNELVRDNERLLRRMIGEDIRLITYLQENIGSIKVDSSHIGQILMNLAINSRDAMPRGGQLIFETSEVDMEDADFPSQSGCASGRYVKLVISDNGNGMTAEVQSHIFEPFFTTKEVGKGTGLGLATVYGIVKQCGGHIALYSEAGFGTTFKIYFPIVPGTEKTTRADIQLAKPRGGTETILLVEDEASVRNIASLILTSQGYTVLTAESGKEALDVVQRHQGGIDLLLTDVIMPGMSGRELSEVLTQKTPKLKVLYASGYTEDAVIRHGILDLEVSFLQKPYTPTSLARKVREILERN
ncbi:PAS domain S-box protein [Telmatocola sphagniphila]|uniref:histidine kinase n=1 Tax=Telmatocola sphagniphila TaxID=1123043 RepID=A0A8E6BBI2_9BACT|nr:PAS domain-containing sensor histidine kinase [Telmatocola sphagniphila]QVL34113.1 PAS domain S-box protein [Telmatocola sphagniphila]